MSPRDRPSGAQLRLGKVTASRVADVTARTKSGWGAARAQYMGQLIVERLTGRAVETFSNAAMAWGLETEPEARRGAPTPSWPTSTSPRWGSWPIRGLR